jgi:hypothetical protein
VTGENVTHDMPNHGLSRSGLASGLNGAYPIPSSFDALATSFGSTQNIAV